MRRLSRTSVAFAVLLCLLFTGAAQAARLTNGTTNYLVSASALTLSGSSKLTLAFWLWVDAFDTGDELAMEYGTVVGNGNFIIDPNDSGNADFTLGAYDLSPSKSRHANATRPSVATWHHYVVSFDRSLTGTAQITGYWIDGATPGGLGILGNDVASAWGDYVLNLMARNSGASLLLAGRIAEVVLYSGYNFVQGDVDSLYNGGAGKDARTVQTPTYYWQLCGKSSPEPALAGGINMTVSGATSTAHPISGAGICPGVFLDAVGTAQSGASGTSANIPITIGSGFARAVVVHFAAGATTTGLTCTMNSGAETLTIVSGTDGGSTTASAILGKVTTLSGAQTVACSWTTNQNYGINALSFTGVDPVTPFNHGTFGHGVAPFSLPVTSTSGDLTTTTNGTDNGSPAVSNQTQEWGIVHAGGDIGPGTGSTTHIWTGGAEEFASGANIVQVQAASSGLFRNQSDLTGVGTGGKFHKDPLQYRPICVPWREAPDAGCDMVIPEEVTR